MGDIRLSILAMDNSLKVLTTHYDSKTSNQLRIFSDQVNIFEKRWGQLIDNLEQCSARVITSFSSKFPDKSLVFFLNNFLS
jgi:hypothetical protein